MEYIRVRSKGIRNENEIYPCVVGEDMYVVGPQ
jgi:hypothetical protein